MKRGRERGEPFSPSRERSELSIFLITLHTPLSTVLKSTRPTASGPPRSSGDLRSRASRSAREAELARLIEKRLEVRGKRLEERRDLDLHTSNLIPLTSVPPRRERSELSIFLITLHAPLSTVLKSTRPTASGPPPARAGILDQEPQDQPAKRN